ncbi:metal-sensitive transcriptional regulator [Leucobacter weissii]|uniref:Metal-sensitive transcriptional regulator n=1 Tax=Leucobacter weissii TaxID=1983706 RepID=A0A939SBT9_9MICO|nr:metal-sensitive transcriptional regulator [Leucobacter weissii]MBO1901693.1 metal-sensitive transcriptional regulator [Leucobacter weissii]
MSTGSVSGADAASANGTDAEAEALERAEAKRKIVNRLRRAHGQLAAVITAVESDAHCRDVVQQLSAVSKALDRAGFLVVSTALKDCLTAPEGEGELDPQELEKLFLSLA